MSDLARRIEGAGRKVQAEWTAERASRVGRSVHVARGRRRAARWMAASALLLLGMGAGWKASSRQTVLPEETLALQLGDGIRAVRLDEQSELRTKASTATSTVVQLVHGGARFKVPHKASRLFRVEVGTLAIEDLGTEFTVERLEAGVRVTVTEGRVQVSWPGGAQMLSQGESARFRPGIAERAAAEAPSPAEPELHPAPARRHPRAKPDSSWKALAEDGEYDAAFDALRGAGMDVPDQTAELLLAVDVARLSHHPAEAVHPLRRIVSSHATDPRAPLAAFTLGRVLLDDLGSPREAAGAFAQARQLEPSGPLAEDALAREVESWSRAGEGPKARALAQHYVEQYPAGRRMKSVSRFGRVE